PEIPAPTIRTSTCVLMLASYARQRLLRMAHGPYFALVDVPSPTVIEHLGDVADLMLEQLDELGSEMDAAIIQASPELGADATIAAEVSASNRANVRRMLSAVARRDGRPPPMDVPPEALDVARTVVRRGIDL